MIDVSFFLALAMFAFVTSVTPGPNNIMLLASGAQFGFRRTLPHMLGIVLGVASLLLSTLMGLGALFTWYPPLYSVLKWVGCAYLLWLAWKIGSAPVGNLETTVSSSPMNWWQALLFQYVNPKAWMMAIGCVSSFAIAGDLYVQSGFWMIVLFAAMGFPAISIWAWAGVSIRRWLTDQKRQRIFNFCMGVATASTLLLIIGN
ncbi:LysE family translocator [Marinomonas rhizomae]|uniref:Threonine/homoserine/homoserine lactone efflux protein n=1 Tax=Marinomonas rhizomae TaxID=491948 RepID=A0A366JF47_9GAMM|nr:LysE family translocator [Marinomonas rhizomae]RBP85596.1 threonine/homoserine/homoserine lactone efflux protein [Marinomonas rhizomae]RNF75774.1 LysE family translocator [Marinomonas rhizomae]